LLADMLERKYDNVMRSIRTIMNSTRLGGEHYLLETLTIFQVKLKLRAWSYWKQKNYHWQSQGR